MRGRERGAGNRHHEAADLARVVPTLSQFFGIAIRVYYDDHPPPHFHATCGPAEAALSIESLAVVQGRLPRRALAMVREWALEHRVELRERWAQARAHAPLAPIPPSR